MVVFASAIGVWELAVRNIDLRGLPLPAPSAIATALVNNWSNGRWPLGKAATATLFEAAGGLTIGTSLGVLMALLTARFATAFLRWVDSTDTDGLPSPGIAVGGAGAGDSAAAGAAAAGAAAAGVTAAGVAAAGVAAPAGAAGAS